MPKVETFWLVDCTSEPFWKVCEVDATFIVPVLDLKQLLEILVLEGIRPKVVKKVLDRNEAIEVFV